MSEHRRPSSSETEGLSGSAKPGDTGDAFDQASAIARVEGDTADSPDSSSLHRTSSPETGFFARRRHRRTTRIPYWDRPKPKRDLNWFLGKLGTSLIILGVLIFLFVGYQLWGTGIEAAQSQNRLEDKFTQIAQTTVPPTPSQPEAVPDPVVISNGDPMAILEMPTLGVTKYVVAGVETGDLKKGPGHYPSTPFPGELGNAAIAGHRTTYGEPFRQLDKLQPGDPIIVTDLLGRRFVYSVTNQLIVQPEDSWVVNTVDPTVAMLTLTTCHPEFSAKQRLIVFATMDTEQSEPVSTPAAVYGANVGLTSGLDELDNDAAAGSPADDTTTNIPDEPGANIVESPSGSVTSETTVEPIDGSTQTPEATTQQGGDDVFNKGWFSDPDAYPHVAFWILIEILIVFGAWQVAKRFRHRGIGLAVGIIPAVVTLYFIFQNVNRLLPPNL